MYRKYRKSLGKVQDKFKKEYENLRKVKVRIGNENILKNKKNKKKHTQKLFKHHNN